MITTPVYGAGPGVVMLLCECSECHKRYTIGRCFPRLNDADLDFYPTAESNTASPMLCVLPAGQINVVNAPMWMENANINPICPNCQTMFSSGQSVVVTSNGDTIKVAYQRDM